MIMAYNEFIADRAQRLNSIGNLEEKKMMGERIFMLNEKMCVGLDINKETKAEHLMVRVGKLPYEELLRKNGSREMNFTGKAMWGFLFIDPDGFDAVVCHTK